MRLARATGRVLVAAAVGVLVLAAVATAGWSVVSQVTGAQFVVFKTGSMSPTIPQGAAAIGLPRQASEFTVGDVVTVWTDESRLPVTHRITGIAPDPDDPAMRLLTLRGDGNAHDDLRPYRVNHGLVVVAATPRLGPVLDLVRTPGFMATATLFAAVAVLWALWPASPRRVPRRAEAP